MSAGLRVYIDRLSAPCRAAYIALKQSGTAFDEVPLALRKGEQLKEDFKNINPLRTIPCIVEGDFKLAESVAILRYLAATNRISESLYSSDVKKRAKIDEFLEWQHLLRHEEVHYFRVSWLFPIVTGKPTPEADLEKAKKAMEKVFDLVENTWLESSKFVAGDQVTLADILGVCEVQQTKLTDYDIRKKYPKIVEWIENVRKGTNPHFDEAHKILYKYAQQKH